MMKVGMAEKIGYAIHFGASFLVSLGLALRVCPTLALTLLLLTPMLAFSGFYLTKILGELGRRMQARGRH